MADRITEDADLAVDELRRRARRRLVGAIVLALAAAVILPLLLEKEPKPLGDDVSVQIPPVDEGKFVNRLTGRSADAKSAAKSDARPLPKVPPKTEAPATPSVATDTADTTTAAETATPPPPASPAPAPVAPTPRKSVSEAEQKVLAGAARTTPPPPKAEPAPAPPAKPATPAVVAPSPSPPVVTAAAAPAPAPASPATAPSAAAGEGFAVQIAAFTDDKGANALVGKLKKAGFASSYTEPVETSRGTLWRVRVGGFASRPDADAARTKLKAGGWNGIVVAVK